ncbi:MAG: hypothetical protein ACXWV8_10165 [Chitinophagaceae bacterium]
MEENKNIEPKQQAESIPGVELPPGGEKITIADEKAMPGAKEREAPSPRTEEATILEIKTTGQTLTKDNMEVHHHAHHGHEKRNWKTYLWEFLMLFLAVFCGFLAEYQLEHTIEQQREKEYAAALYDEFLADSVAVANKISARLDKEKDCDYLISYIKDSSLTALPKDFYPAYTTVFYLINSYTFEPKDGVLSQLKGSGSLRYFKNATVQKLFGDISVCTNNVRYRNEQEYQFFASPIKPFILKHYDFRWVDELRKRKPNAYNMDLISQYRESDTIINAAILNLPSFDRSEVMNMIMFYKTMLVSSRTLQMNDYIKANSNLLQVLRDNYSLGNE